MRRLARGGYRRAGAAGVAFAYFALVGLPVLFFGAGLATDFTRIIIAGREVSNAAQAAALAGAQDFSYDSAALKSTGPDDAQAWAVQTYCRARGAGELALSAPSGATTSCPDGSSVSVTVTLDTGGTGDAFGNPVYDQVDVTARYTVTGLIFTQLFGAGHEFTPGPVTRTAIVCVPGSDGPTDGYCAHPAR